MTANQKSDDRAAHQEVISPSPTKPDNNFFVVGIGASAGGLSALEELFTNLPIDSGAAFVVIQHLSPDFKSLMKELLQRRTEMAVHRVTEGMKLQPNSVYLIPPGKNLEVKDNLLRLEERKKDKNQKLELNFPIDIFFQSLAENYREKGIGVILSGSGSDGTRGLRAINEAGGVSLVQDPSTAEFDGMPRSEIATGVVNQILSPRELAQLIYQCIVSPLDSSESNSSQGNLLNESNLQEISSILVETEDLDFSHYKSSTLSRRIRRRRLINNFQNIESYITLLNNSAEERKILCSDLLINVTYFFRNPQAWKNLENNILPVLIEQAKPGEELRFWVTACSTGEEAYSLAILVSEALQNTEKPVKAKIFATDIDRKALEKASLGVYSPSIANDMSPELLQKHFIAKDNGYRVRRKLREMMIFSPHDLTKDAGFTRIHLISCRNVLIYMQSDLQSRVLRNLHFSLINQGVLFLGEAETLGTFEPEFKPLNKKWKFYQKRRDIRLPLSLRTTSKTANNFAANSVLRSPPAKLDNARQTTSMREQSLKRILNDSNSVALLVDKNNRLLHVCGNASKIFQPLDGEIVTEVTKMVISPLKLPLNTALHRAKKEQKSVLYTGIKLQHEADSYEITLKVIPPNAEESGDFFLIQIDRQKIAQMQVLPQSEFKIDNEAQRQILELEHELQQTRENLQALVEELETTNEEQQASNEELTASNEELQSTNEELHSVNEELHTVNIEYQSKILELTELNNDIDNLLKSTDIGVIFLDRDLTIRKYTPSATDAIALRYTDIDRPLEELSYKIECPELIELLTQVMATKQTQELEVKLKHSNSYLLMRINLYQTEERQDDGIVISFIKIDEIKKVQLQLETTLVDLRSREIELNQLNHQLEARVAERTTSLADFSDKLEQLHRLATTSRERIEDLFADYLQTGCQLFDLSTGIISRVEDSTYQILAVRSPLPLFVGYKARCQETYCVEVLESKKTIVYSHVGEVLEMRNHPAYLNFKLESFIGTPIMVNGTLYGTLNFSSIQPRSVEFEAHEQEIIELMARDIGQSIAALHTQKSLLQSESRFRSTFEKAAAGIAHVSLQGQFIKVNQRLGEMLGYKDDRLVELTFQEITHPDDLNADIQYIQQMLNREIETCSFEKRYLHQNSTIVWVNLTVSLVKSNSGKPEYFIAVIEDIGDRKKTELALTENRNKLQQANLAKDSFIAHMSHELRTPLNSILGFSSILQKEANLNEEQLNGINIVHESGQYLLDLINDILDFSKIEAGKMQLEEQEFNLVSFLANLATVCRFRAQQKGLKFIYRESPSLPTIVKADETRLRQVLLNLLSNAIKFTETGSVTLLVDPVEDNAYLAQSRQNSQPYSYKICFQIKDTGNGIHPGELTKIFVPFEQLEGDKNQEGTGLGLSISQDIVRLMNDDIQIESVVGKGSIFSFNLELAVLTADSTKISSSTVPQSQQIDFDGEPSKVLVVDGNDDRRFLIVSYLHPLGFILEQAKNASAGLLEAQVFAPDLIILDSATLAGDVESTIAKIRQQPQLQNLVVLVIAAETDMQPEVKGCNALLAQPLDSEKLLEVLKTHLHLDWIIPEAKTFDNCALTAPPEAELIELLKIVRSGNIDAIESKIKLLEEMNTEYNIFTREAQQIADKFKLDELTSFIEKLLNKQA